MTDKPVLKIMFDHFYGDAEHRFGLGYLQLKELEEKTGVGPFALYRKLAAADHSATDVRETIRLGLIGGGMKPYEANTLLVRNHDPYPLDTDLALATLIMAARLFGLAPKADPIVEAEVAA